MVAFALLVAQAGVLAHFAVVRHAYSPEVDDLTELTRARDPLDARRSPLEPGIYPSDGENDGEHGHDRCLQTGHKRDGVTPAPASVQSTAWAAAAPVDRGLAEHPTSTALYLVAPKQSPPSA